MNVESIVTQVEPWPFTEHGPNGDQRDLSPIFHICLISGLMSPPGDMNLASTVFHVMTSGDLGPLPVDCLAVMGHFATRRGRPQI